jgi:hypothetical protein
MAAVTLFCDSRMMLISRESDSNYDSRRALFQGLFLDLFHVQDDSRFLGTITPI